MQWFDVNKEGLAKLLDRTGRHRVVAELVANAFDAPGVTRVDVELTQWGHGKARIKVTDDSPEGFQDLSHAWTLFAESNRKGDAEKRGRFNLGEKLALAVCEQAAIATTTGTVIFNNAGRTVHEDDKRESGSEFAAKLVLTPEQVEAAEGLIEMILPPDGVTLVLNGEAVDPPRCVKEFNAYLPTEYADEFGVVHRTSRTGEVKLYGAGKPWLYELGIPVMPLDAGDPWHVDVGQKIPLGMDRESVGASFVRDVRGRVLEEMVDLMTPDEARGQWVDDALDSWTSTPETAGKVVNLRFPKPVVGNPMDPESARRAVAAGMTVVPSNAFSRAVWEKVRKSELVPVSTTLFPTTEPYSSDPAATPVEVVPPVAYTDEQQKVVGCIERIGAELVGGPIVVRIVKGKGLPWDACYGGRRLDLNLSKLKMSWFTQACYLGQVEMHALVIHELAHEWERNHLDDGYYHKLCELGGKLVALALVNPKLVTP